MRGFIRFSVITSGVVLALLLIALCAAMQLMPTLNVQIDGVQWEQGNWLTTGMTLLLSAIVLAVALLVVLLIGIGLPLLLIAGGLAIAALAIVGASALMLSPFLLLIAAAVWLYRLSAKPTTSTNP